MPQLAAQFEQAKSNVSPPPDDVSNASEAHTEVRQALETSQVLSGFAIDTILIGSYARHVAIRRIKDVDVFSKLPRVPSTIAPGQLLDLFHKILASEFGCARVDPQERSIKVDFPDYDLCVDAVPARPYGSHWAVPDRCGGWEETNPEFLGSLTTDLNSDHDGHYVPTVKLIRQARRAQLGDGQPGGLYVEIACYHAFVHGLAAVSASEYFYEALGAVATQLNLARTGGLADPTLPGHVISTRATDTELARAAHLFHGLATRAQAALNSDDACFAAFEFREVLGTTSDGNWVFPMPSYCNDDGTPKRSTAGIRSGSPTVPQDGRFAG